MLQLLRFQSSPQTSITCDRGQGLGGNCTSKWSWVVDTLAAPPTTAWKSRRRMVQVSVRYWANSYWWTDVRFGRHSDSASLSTDKSLGASRAGRQSHIRSLMATFKFRKAWPGSWPLCWCLHWPLSCGKSPLATTAARITLGQENPRSTAKIAVSYTNSWWKRCRSSKNSGHEKWLLSLCTASSLWQSISDTNTITGIIGVTFNVKYLTLSLEGIWLSLELAVLLLWTGPSKRQPLALNNSGSPCSCLRLRTY